MFSNIAIKQKGRALRHAPFAILLLFIFFKDEIQSFVIILPEVIINVIFPGYSIFL